MIEPVDYAVISQSLSAVAREMGAKLVRSAYSSIVRDAKDASTGILDVSGSAVAQSDELIPVLVSSLSQTFAYCSDASPPDTLTPDDFYISNHPYQGGQHLQDIFVFLPVFHGDRLVAFAASVAHHLDIGGGAPGLNVNATDYFQEGIVIPPSRYSFSRDWNGGAFERLLAANVRVPEQTIGDINAQMAATRVGASRIRELCGKYGPDLVTAVMSEMIAYSERRIRAAIAAVPDGTYRGEDAVDDDGVSDMQLPVRATVTVKGDQLTVDYSGTAPQVSTNMNSPLASTISSTLSCLKSILTEAEVPFNEGARRAITISAPEGSLLNPRPPAPVRARMEAIYRAYDAVLKALTDAVPERTIAPGYDSTVATCLSHLGGKGYSVYLEVHNGGYGASAFADGCDAVAGPLSNCTNVPVEALDMNFDFFRISEYRLRPNSGGAGTYRGGLGLIRSYLILADDVVFSIYADRFRVPAAGSNGGEAGQCGKCEVLRGDEIISVPSKASVRLRRGDLLILSTGGGGGHGDPAARREALIRLDREDGLMTAGKDALAEAQRPA